MYPNKLFRSFAFRQGLLYLGLFALSALVLLGFIYWYSDGYLSRQTDATIETEITAFAEHYERAGLAGLQRLINSRLRRQRPTTSSLYLLTDPRYRPVTGNLSRWPPAAGDGAPGAWIDFRLESAGDDKARPARARTFRLRGGYHLLVGRDLHDLQRVRAALGQALSTGLLITLLLGLAGALVISRAGTRRIEVINQACRAIMRGDLARRIASRGSGDDLDQLIDTLNRMLDRIQELMEGVRRVSDNIAHDLRTPLARLHRRLEAIRDHEGRRRDAARSDTGAMLEAALRETDGLMGTFNSLLRIARVEARTTTGNNAPLDLALLLQDVVELYQPVAEGRHQNIVTDFARTPQIRGDHDLLFQAFANILDNAIKFTPHHGRITVLLRHGHDGAAPIVTIADSGPGIAAKIRDQVFQRFFRAEQSRSTEGNGLGLSLVKAVADQHGIGIRLEDNLPGLRVVMVFAAGSAEGEGEGEAPAV